MITFRTRWRRWRDRLLDGLANAAAGKPRKGESKVVAPVFAARQYRDIGIAGPEAIREQVIRGGPVWPDWPAPSPGRMLRGCKLVDEPSASPVTARRRLRRPAIWVGMAVPHFGHFCAEQAPRALTAREARPEGAALLLLPPGGSRRGLETYHWQVLDWFGVAARDVVTVDRPLEVDDLVATVQGEHLNGPLTSDAYLSLLDRNASRRGLTPESAAVVYVGRAKPALEGMAHHAGEGYVTSLLRRAGIDIMQPEELSLRRQLARYAGARTLVFAEGSALHGRQLLGRIDQHITVLVRRPGARLARNQIGPRAAGLDYAEVTKAVLETVTLDGRVERHLALALYDLGALAQTWSRLGVDLTGLDRDEAFKAAELADVRLWLRRRLAAPQADRTASVDRVRGALDLCGRSALRMEDVTA